MADFEAKQKIPSPEPVTTEKSAESNPAYFLELIKSALPNQPEYVPTIVLAFNKGLASGVHEMSLEAFTFRVAQELARQDRSKRLPSTSL